MSQPKATNSNFGQTKNICCMEYSLMPKKKKGIIDDNVPKRPKISTKMSVNFHWHNDIYSTTLLEHFSFGDIWDMAMSTTFCKNKLYFWHTEERWKKLIQEKKEHAYLRVHNIIYDSDEKCRYSRTYIYWLGIGARNMRTSIAESINTRVIGFELY